MDKKMKIKKPDPVIPNVTAEGSLGLLALGDVGLRIWRKKIQEEKEKSKDQKNG
jgi:hypothetical protein